MSERNYWQRMKKRQYSRRSLLQASARAGVGAAGIMLIGCGDDDDGQQQAAPAAAQAQQQQQASPAQAQEQQQQQAAVAQAQQQQSGPKPGGTMRVGTGRALAEHQAAFPFGAWGEAFPLYAPMLEGLTRYGKDTGTGTATG